MPADIAQFGATATYYFADGSPIQNELDLSLYIPEAENPVEDAIFRAQGSALPVPANILDSFPEDGVHLKDHLAEIERNLIMKALEESNGNVSQSARLLNLQRTTLIEKINKYNLA